jgi:hypothetical protein
MLDQSEGTAELRAKRPLDCEEKRIYDMEVAAVSCTGQISPRYLSSKVLSVEGKRSRNDGIGILEYRHSTPRAI